jgi:hypothetical protein
MIIAGDKASYRVIQDIVRGMSALPNPPYPIQAGMAAPSSSFTLSMAALSSGPIMKGASRSMPECLVLQCCSIACFHTTVLQMGHCAGQLVHIGLSLPLKFGAGA